MGFLTMAISIAVLALILIVTIVGLASRYRRCPSDQVLVIYGKVGKEQSAKCIHGGGTFVWPLIQAYAYLDLTPMTITIPLRNALSLQNIRVDVPSTFTVGVSTSEGVMTSAAERLLNLKAGDIESLAGEIIFGQMRLTIASLTIEDINQDREKFLEEIRKNVEPELNKIGLYLINVNVTDLTDESQYIESIGRKASSEAINKAKIDVSEQQKLGTIGEAENLAAAAKGSKQAEADQRIYVRQQESEAVAGENTAQAAIADSEAQLKVAQAEAAKTGQVAENQAEVEVQKSLYLAEQERMRAETIVKEEIDKQKIEIEAEASAEKTRRVARGEADAALMAYDAEAQGIDKVLTAKAQGYEKIVEACGNDSQAAATFLMVEKIEELVKLQVSAIKDLQIDKVVVWDSGANGNGKGATADFASGLIQALPPLHDVAKMAGVKLPGFLGSLDPEGNLEKEKSYVEIPPDGAQPERLVERDQE